jgi:hypothetical protein
VEVRGVVNLYCPNADFSFPVQLTRPGASSSPGREGLGVGAAEALGGAGKDCLQDAVRIFVQFVIPDPKDRPAFASKELVASPVPLGLGMRAAAELHNQPSLPAGEVGEVRANRKLPSEFRAQAGDHGPKPALVPSRSVAEFARACGSVERNTAAHVCSIESVRASRTHPQPLPSREGPVT